MRRRPWSVQVFLCARQPGEHGAQAWRYLLLQRHARPELALPDFWQGVSGALEPDEDFDQAAQREVWEETGFQRVAVQPTGFEHRYPIQDAWRQAYGPGPQDVLERVFWAELPTQAVPRLSPEHQGFLWCTGPQAQALLSYGANAQCLSAVQRCLHP